jgi:copper oxidase (laccase) domain-containing protein
VGSGFCGVRREQVAGWFSPDGDRWRLDLWTANRDQLTAAGVPAEQVHVACHCTATMLDRYFSYRIEGAKAGRLVAAIRGKSL